MSSLLKNGSSSDWYILGNAQYRRYSHWEMTWNPPLADIVINSTYRKQGSVQNAGPSHPEGLKPLFVAVSPFGGSIAVIVSALMASRSASKELASCRPSLKIYSAAGSCQMRVRDDHGLCWPYDGLVAAEWSVNETLVTVFKDGAVRCFSPQGTKEQIFSLVQNASVSSESRSRRILLASINSTGILFTLEGSSSIFFRRSISVRDFSITRLGSVDGIPICMASFDFDLNPSGGEKSKHICVLVSTSKGALWIIHATRSLSRRIEVPGVSSHITCIRISPSGSLVALFSVDGFIAIISTSVLLGAFASTPVTAVSLSALSAGQTGDKISSKSSKIQSQNVKIENSNEPLPVSSDKCSSSSRYAKTSAQTQTVQNIGGSNHNRVDSLGSAEMVLPTFSINSDSVFVTPSPSKDFSDAAWVGNDCLALSVHVPSAQVENQFCVFFGGPERKWIDLIFPGWVQLCPMADGLRIVTRSESYFLHLGHRHTVETFSVGSRSASAMIYFANSLTQNETMEQPSRRLQDRCADLFETSGSILETDRKLENGSGHRNLDMQLGRHHEKLVVHGLNSLCLDGSSAENENSKNVANRNSLRDLRAFAEKLASQTCLSENDLLNCLDLQYLCPETTCSTASGTDTVLTGRDKIDDVKMRSLDDSLESEYKGVWPGGSWGVPLSNCEESNEDKLSKEYFEITDVDQEEFLDQLDTHEIEDVLSCLLGALGHEWDVKACSTLLRAYHTAFIYLTSKGLKDIKSFFDKILPAELFAAYRDMYIVLKLRLPPYELPITVNQMKEFGIMNLVSLLNRKQQHGFAMDIIRMYSPQNTRASLCRLNLKNDLPVLLPHKASPVGVPEYACAECETCKLFGQLSAPPAEVLTFSGAQTVVDYMAAVLVVEDITVQPNSKQNVLATQFMSDGDIIRVLSKRNAHFSPTLRTAVVRQVAWTAARSGRKALAEKALEQEPDPKVRAFFHTQCTLDFALAASICVQNVDEDLLYLVLSEYFSCKSHWDTGVNSGMNKNGLPSADQIRFRLKEVEKFISEISHSQSSRSSICSIIRLFVFDKFVGPSCDTPLDVKTDIGLVQRADLLDKLYGRSGKFQSILTWDTTEDSLELKCRRCVTVLSDQILSQTETIIDKFISNESHDVLKLQNSESLCRRRSGNSRTRSDAAQNSAPSSKNPNTQSGSPSTVGPSGKSGGGFLFESFMTSPFSSLAAAVMQPGTMLGGAVSGGAPEAPAAYLASTWAAGLAKAEAAGQDLLRQIKKEKQNSSNQSVGTSVPFDKEQPAPQKTENDSESLTRSTNDFIHLIKDQILLLQFQRDFDNALRLKGHTSWNDVSAAAGTVGMTLSDTMKVVIKSGIDKFVEDAKKQFKITSKTLLLYKLEVLALSGSWTLFWTFAAFCVNSLPATAFGVAALQQALHDSDRSGTFGSKDSGNNYIAGLSSFLPLGTGTTKITQMDILNHSLGKATHGSTLFSSWLSPPGFMGNVTGGNKNSSQQFLPATLAGAGIGTSAETDNSNNTESNIKINSKNSSSALSPSFHPHAPRHPLFPNATTGSTTQTNNNILSSVKSNPDSPTSLFCAESLPVKLAPRLSVSDFVSVAHQHGNHEIALALLPFICPAEVRDRWASPLGFAGGSQNIEFVKYCFNVITAATQSSSSSNIGGASSWNTNMGSVPQQLSALFSSAVKSTIQPINQASEQVRETATTSLVTSTAVSMATDFI